MMPILLTMSSNKHRQVSYMKLGIGMGNRILSDSHIHFDQVWDSGLTDVLNAEQMMVFSWAWVPTLPENGSALARYFQSQKEVCAWGREKRGLEVWRLVGIHPRSIPVSVGGGGGGGGGGGESVERLVLLLEEAALEEDVVGVGECGLEGADLAIEEKIFRLNVELALRLGLPLAVHTPRKDKQRILDRELAILDEYSFPAGRAVLDHLNDADMLEKVLARGYHCGITVSDSKLSPAHAGELIETFQAYSDRLMINSDAITYVPDEYVKFLSMGQILPKSLLPVLGLNACRFFEDPINPIQNL